MKRTILAVTTLALLLGAASAFAAEMKGGLGFHTYNAPIGIRHWVNESVAIDAGFGFNSSTSTSGSPAVDIKQNGWNVEVGLPFSLKKWDRVNFIVRPGFGYGSSKYEPPSPSISFTNTSLTVTGELEVEVRIVENVSLSAAHGVSYFSSENDLTPKSKTSGYNSIGNNFTQIGFHVYLW